LTPSCKWRKSDYWKQNRRQKCFNVSPQSISIFHIKAEISPDKSINKQELFLMFCWPCIIIYYYHETNVMHFLFNLLRIKASTCFEHYLLNLRRCYTNGTWYIACVLCQLAAPSAANLYLYTFTLVWEKDSLYHFENKKLK
jgi:hypothetical protein